MVKDTFSDTEIVCEFVEESLESLDGMAERFLDLEQCPNDRSLIDDAFRPIHSIKGTSGCLQLSNVESLSHQLENVLDAIRKSKLSPSGDVIDILLRGVDHLVELLRDCNESGQKLRSVNKLFLEEIAACLENGGANGRRATLQQEVARWIERAETDPSLATSGMLGELKSVIEKASRKHVTTQPKTGTDTTTSATTTSTLPAATNSEASDSSGKAATNAQAGAGNLRVDAGKLDLIVTVAGDLLSWNEQLSHFATKLANTGMSVSLLSDCGELHQNLAGLTNTLHRALQEIQEVPARQITRILMRSVRDVSRQLGKTVLLRVIGDHVELDRRMLTVLRDPLVHLVRNALDHGIEDPEERVNLGKDPEGHIEIHIDQDNGYVTLTIQDDGAGIDVEAVRAKAIESGLTTESAVLSDEQIHEFVLHPGFSTARQVTGVSGRGVGMDVVVSNLKKADGTVNISSEKGRGTTITLVVPKHGTLVQEGAVVRVGSATYMLPLDAIGHISAFDAATQTHMPGGPVLVSVGDKTLPLGSFYHTEKDTMVHDFDTEHTQALIEIEDSSKDRCFLLVDAVLGIRKALIKPSGDDGLFPPLISGTFLLSNGGLGLFVNVDNVVTESTNYSTAILSNSIVSSATPARR